MAEGLSPARSSESCPISKSSFEIISFSCKAQIIFLVAIFQRIHGYLIYNVCARDPANFCLVMFLLYLVFLKVSMFVFLSHSRLSDLF